MRSHFFKKFKTITRAASECATSGQTAAPKCISTRPKTVPPTLLPSSRKPLILIYHGLRPNRRMSQRYYPLIISICAINPPPSPN